MTSEKQLFLRHLAQTSDAPMMLEIERAQGAVLYGREGRQWIDLISGISVSNLGHGNARIIEAIQKQAGDYLHTMVYGEFIQHPQVLLASKLTSMLPASLDSVFFVNSGSEAVEGALKLAKRVTGRPQLAAFKNAYHGSSNGAMSMGGDENYKRPFRPLLPGILNLDYGTPEALTALHEGLAAVLIEPIQAEAGIRIPSTDWLRELRAICTRLGILLIFDEIQTGCGRTGSLFAFENSGVVPDVLLLAKAFGGGMPLGAFVASRKLMGELTYEPVLGHISTFGGHPVCCAAGLASLEQLCEMDFNMIAEKSNRFMERLEHPLILQKRRAGLLIALEFDSFERNKFIIDHCLENGVLTDWFLFSAECLRIAPPLIISDEEIDRSCDVLLQAMERADQFEPAGIHPDAQPH